VIKSGRLSWAERVANKGDRKGSYRFLVGGGEPQEIDNLVDLSVDGRSSKWILKKLAGKAY